MRFSASDAAFEGFRVVRRKPMTLVWWTLAYILFFALFFTVALGPLSAFVGAVEGAQGATTPDELAPLMGAWFGLMTLLLPLGLLFGAVLQAGVARSVLEPGRSAFGYLRLGADELRVLAVTVILALLAIFGFGGVGLVLGGLGGVVAAALGDAGWLVTFALFLGMAIAAIWIGARFSLAVPITLAEKRIAPFASWSVTKGRAWPIVGMALLAWILTVVVSILFSIVLFPITMALGMSGGLTRLEGLETADIGQVLGTMGPFLAVMVLTQAVGAALQLAVLYAPFSAAYRDLTAERGEA